MEKKRLAIIILKSYDYPVGRVFISALITTAKFFITLFG